MVRKILVFLAFVNLITLVIVPAVPKDAVVHDNKASSDDKHWYFKDYFSLDEDAQIAFLQKALNDKIDMDKEFFLIWRNAFYDNEVRLILFLINHSIALETKIPITHYGDSVTLLTYTIVRHYLTRCSDQLPIVKALLDKGARLDEAIYQDKPVVDQVIDAYTKTKDVTYRNFLLPLLKLIAPKFAKDLKEDKPLVLSPEQRLIEAMYTNDVKRVVAVIKQGGFDINLPIPYLGLKQKIKSWLLKCSEDIMVTVLENTNIDSEILEEMAYEAMRDQQKYVIKILLQSSRTGVKAVKTVLKEYHNPYNVDWAWTIFDKYRLQIINDAVDSVSQINITLQLGGIYKTMAFKDAWKDAIEPAHRAHVLESALNTILAKKVPQDQIAKLLRAIQKIHTAENFIQAVVDEIDEKIKECLALGKL